MCEAPKVYDPLVHEKFFSTGKVFFFLDRKPTDFTFPGEFRWLFKKANHCQRLSSEEIGKIKRALDEKL